MAVDHYENFPVASILLPARLRYPVEVIYAFARSADDIADEGNATTEERQAGLDSYLDKLDAIERDIPVQNALFSRLKEVIHQHNLPLQPFRDLLSAFRQDTHTPRYHTYSILLDYCRRSANPVGRLMLHLYNAATEENVRMSDAVCTALQLINFWQDVAVDWQKNRVYIPMEDLARFRVSEEMIAASTVNQAWCALMQFEIRRTRELMLSGAALPKRIPGRIGWELRFVIHGGLRILERIESAGFDVFNKRPTLGKKDWLRILWRSAAYHF
ncbi:squalene synthase HpnC [Oxalobacter sp. OttesenSCG-928-P03]|nr:squalene synthase HpnC [Oxalobacter sp. OttesenSCG-928-P03]